MSSTKVVPTKETTIKGMAIMLTLAFVGGQLGSFGTFTAFIAALAFSEGTFLGSPKHPNIGAGIMMAVLAVLLLLASFLALSLYPKHGRHQMVAGFLALVALVVVSFPIARLLELAHTYETSSPTLEISFGIAIAVCLLVSGTIKGWLSLVGLGLGLAIGVGLRMTSLYHPVSLDFSPLWLSAVFFPELLSRRAGWRTALVGALLWIGLIALSVLATYFLPIP